MQARWTLSVSVSVLAIAAQASLGCATGVASTDGTGGASEQGGSSPSTASAGSSGSTYGGSVRVTPASGDSVQGSGQDGTSCAQASPNAMAYVDETAGSDDAEHGGAAGSCAYKTLTYALAHAQGSIVLAAGNYPGPGDTLPFVLGGRQALVCDRESPAVIGYDASAVADREGSAVAPLVPLVRLAGTGNTVNGCTFDGLDDATVACVDVAPTSTRGHTVENDTFEGCGGVGVLVEDDVQGAAVRGNRFERTELGVSFGARVSGAITGNAFSGAGAADIECADHDGRNVSGGDNTRDNGSATCVDCAACPFL